MSGWDCRSINLSGSRRPRAFSGSTRSNPEAAEVKKFCDNYGLGKGSYSGRRAIRKSKLSQPGALFEKIALRKPRVTLHIVITHVSVCTWTVPK